MSDKQNKIEGSGLIGEMLLKFLIDTNQKCEEVKKAKKECDRKRGEVEEYLSGLVWNPALKKFFDNLLDFQNPLIAGKVGGIGFGGYSGEFELADGSPVDCSKTYVEGAKTSYPIVGILMEKNSAGNRLYLAYNKEENSEKKSKEGESHPGKPHKSPIYFTWDNNNMSIEKATEWFYNCYEDKNRIKDGIEKKITEIANGFSNVLTMHYMTLKKKEYPLQ